MIEKREKKENDKQMIFQAYEIIFKTTKENPQLEGCHWVCAMLDHVADSFKISGFSYEEFKKHMDVIIIDYKKIWHDKN